MQGPRASRTPILLIRVPSVFHPWLISHLHKVSVAKFGVRPSFMAHKKSVRGRRVSLLSRYEKTTASSSLNAGDSQGAVGKPYGLGDLGKVQATASTQAR